MRKQMALSAFALLVAACGILPWVPAAPPEAPPPEKAPAVPTPAEKPLPKPAPPAAVPSAGTSTETPPPPSAGSIADNAYARGSSALEEGNPGRALDLLAEAWKEDPGHPGVGQAFAAALERLKKQGDDAEQKGKPEEAGKAWTASLSYLSHPAVKGRNISFTRSHLKENLDRLSKSLMAKGLMEYREGRFASAISWWQKILAYDPSNEEALKSVRTATTQLENLRKITPRK